MRAWILKGGTPSMAGVEPNIHIPDERAQTSVKAAFHSPGNKGKIIINQAQPCTLGPASLEPMIWQGSGSEHVSQLLQALQRFRTSLRIKSTLLQRPTGLCRSDPSRLEAPPGPTSTHSSHTPPPYKTLWLCPCCSLRQNTLPLVPPTPVHLFFRLHLHVPLSKCPSVTSIFYGPFFSCIFLPGLPTVCGSAADYSAEEFTRNLGFWNHKRERRADKGAFQSRTSEKGPVKNENASQVSNSRVVTKPGVLLSMGCCTTPPVTCPGNCKMQP